MSTPTRLGGRRLGAQLGSARGILAEQFDRDQQRCRVLLVVSSPGHPGVAATKHALAGELPLLRRLRLALLSAVGGDRSQVNRWDPSKGADYGDRRVAGAAVFDSLHAKFGPPEPSNYLRSILFDESGEQLIVRDGVPITPAEIATAVAEAAHRNDKAAEGL